MNNKTDDNIELLTHHIEELYARVALLSQHNVETYNSLNQFDGHMVHTEPCQSSQWNIYTTTQYNEIDVAVYVSTGGYNQYKQMPALVTINGSHIQLDFDMPYSGYVMYREITSNTPLPYPTSYGPDFVSLKTDEDYIEKVADLDMTQVSIVSDPTDAATIIKNEPF